MGQLNKPTIKNPALVQAMADFKSNQSPATEEAMLTILQSASLIAPVQLDENLDNIDQDENGEKKVNGHLLAVQNKDGVRVFPAFTDWIEFLKWKDDPDADTMILTFDQYCDLLLKRPNDMTGIVINPAEASLLIRKEKMAQLKNLPLPSAAAAPQNSPSNSAISALLGANNLQNDELVEVMIAFRTEKTPELQNRLFNLLRAGKFIIPAFVHDMPKEIHPNEKIQAKAEFILLNRGDQKFLPLFTAMSELQKWSAAPQGCTGMPLPFTQIVSILNDPKNQASGIVIDPFTQGLSLPKQQVLLIAPQIRFTETKIMPLDMLSQLKTYLATDSYVKSAYLATIQINNADGYLIAIDTDLGSPKVTVDAITDIVKKFGTCAVAPVASPLGKKAIEGKTPFYQA